MTNEQLASATVRWVAALRIIGKLLSQQEDKP